MKCEQFKDFVAICHFLNTFGKAVLSSQADNLPTFFQLKYFIENSNKRK